MWVYTSNLNPLFFGLRPSAPTSANFVFHNEHLQALMIMRKAEIALNAMGTSGLLDCDFSDHAFGSMAAYRTV